MSDISGLQVSDSTVIIATGAIGPQGPPGTGEGGGPGVSDHGLLAGLGDDDHPQYLTNARGDARYPSLAALAAELAARAAADAAEAAARLAADNAEAAARAAADALLIPLAQRAAANGVATLDAGGKIPSAQLPPVALGETFTVGSEAAMLALPAQAGDMAVRTDLDPDGFFILTTNNPGTLGDWRVITAVGSIVSVNGQVGVVVLEAGDVGAPTIAALDAEAAARAAGDAAEAVTRAAADTALDGRLDAIEALGPLATDAALDAEVTRAQAAEGDLSDGLDDEAVARGAADVLLDGRLDAIEANGWVTLARVAGSVLSGAGTLGARPNANTVPAGFIYLATDENGGTAYRSTGAAWVALGPGATQYGGRLLDRKENLTDVTCTSVTVPVAIPNLSSTVAKVAGRSLTVVMGARAYHSTATATVLMQLLVDGVLEEELQWNSQIANGIGESEKAFVFDALAVGNHTFACQMLCVGAGSTGHLWGAVKAGARGAHRTHLSIYES